MSKTTEPIKMTDDLRAALQQLFPDTELQVKDLEKAGYQINSSKTTWAILGAFYKKAFDLLHKEFPAAWELIRDGFSRAEDRHEERMAL